MFLLGKVIYPLCPTDSLPNTDLMHMIKSVGGHSCTTGQIQSFSHLTQTTDPAVVQLPVATEEKSWQQCQLPNPVSKNMWFQKQLNESCLDLVNSEMP